VLWWKRSIYCIRHNRLLFPSDDRYRRVVTVFSMIILPLSFERITKRRLWIKLSRHKKKILPPVKSQKARYSLVHIQLFFLRNGVPERLNSGSMHRQMQEQNCFQLPPALTVVFIVGGHYWQKRKNGEPMIFFLLHSACIKKMQVLFIYFP